MCLARGSYSVNIGCLDYQVSTENREVHLLLESRLKGPFRWAQKPVEGSARWQGPRARRRANGLRAPAPALRT